MFVQRTKKAYAMFLRETEQHPRLVLSYEELASDLKGCLGSLVAPFLTLKQRECETKLKRQVQQAPEQIISNFEEIREEFSEEMLVQRCE